MHFLSHELTIILWMRPQPNTAYFLSKREPASLEQTLYGLNEAVIFTQTADEW